MHVPHMTIPVQISRHSRLFLLQCLCVLHGSLKAGVLKNTSRVRAYSVIELFVDGVF